MKDYYATLKIQQGRLKAAMNAGGFKNVAALSRKCGCAPAEIYNLINFRLSPKTRLGEWRKVTLTICRVLGYTPDSLFPEHLHRELPTNEIASFVEREQLEGLSIRQIGPREECEQAEMEHTIKNVLKTIPDREREIIEASFWEGKTFEQIGIEQGVSASRIGSVRAKALRRLRHPTRIRELRGLSAFG